MQNTPPSQIIDAFGGTRVVALLCDTPDGVVSGWRKRGIPKAWLKFLKEKNPPLFASINSQEPQP